MERTRERTCKEGFTPVQWRCNHFREGIVRHALHVHMTGCTRAPLYVIVEAARTVGGELVPASDESLPVPAPEFLGTLMDAGL